MSYVTMNVNPKVKEQLLKLKIVPSETVNDLLKRLIEIAKKDKEKNEN